MYSTIQPITPPADRDTEDVIIYDLGGGTFDITLASIIKSKADDFDAYEFDNTTKPRWPSPPRASGLIILEAEDFVVLSNS